MVMLPDHLHAVWTLPDDDADYSIRWRQIKSWVTRHCPERLLPNRTEAKARRSEQELWQRRFWEHRICDEQDLARHVDYIHCNPVKHGVAANPGDWPFSKALVIRNAMLKHGTDWEPAKATPKAGAAAPQTHPKNNSCYGIALTSAPVWDKSPHAT